MTRVRTHRVDEVLPLVIDTTGQLQESLVRSNKRHHKLAAIALRQAIIYMEAAQVHLQNDRTIEHEPASTEV